MQRIPFSASALTMMMPANAGKAALSTTSVPKEDKGRTGVNEKVRRLCATLWLTRLHRSRFADPGTPRRDYFAALAARSPRPPPVKKGFLTPFE
jgi:hypothetical protein